LYSEEGSGSRPKRILFVIRTIKAINEDVLFSIQFRRIAETIMIFVESRVLSYSSFVIGTGGVIQAGRLVLED